MGSVQPGLLVRLFYEKNNFPSFPKLIALQLAYLDVFDVDKLGRVDYASHINQLKEKRRWGGIK